MVDRISCTATGELMDHPLLDKHAESVLTELPLLNNSRVQKAGSLAGTPADEATDHP